MVGGFFFFFFVSKKLLQTSVSMKDVALKKETYLSIAFI